jgi:molecular chaperone HtpG
VKAALGDDVKEVRVSSRLTESPACLVADEHDMGANLQRVLKQLGQDAPQTKPILELNLKHPLVEKMDQEPDEERFADLSRVLLDQATLAEGGQLEDPAAFVHRLNKLMLSLSA